MSSLIDPDQSSPALPENHPFFNVFADNILFWSATNSPFDPQDAFTIKIATGEFILFLDDFNLVTQNSDFPLEFFSFLRSLANNFNVAYVTSSYQDLQKLCVSKDIEESPFFNIFTNITLRAFDPEVVKKLVSQKSTNSKITFDDQMMLIQEYSGTFPYLVQLAGDIIAKMQEMSSNPISKEKFKKLLFDQSENYFFTLWDNLKEDYKILLAMIVSGRKITESQQYMIKELIRKNYITEEGRRLVLFSPLFTEFVTRERKIKTSSINTTLFNKIFNFFRFENRNFHL